MLPAVEVEVTLIAVQALADAAPTARQVLCAWAHLPVCGPSHNTNLHVPKYTVGYSLPPALTLLTLLVLCTLPAYTLQLHGVPAFTLPCLNP